MGYILPVERYQYHDYQIRNIQENQNKHFIEKPFKVILEKRHHEISNEYERLNGVPKGYRQPVTDQSAAEKFYGELTGKGMNFTEKV